MPMSPADNSLVAAAGAGNTDTAETLSFNLYAHEAAGMHSVSWHAAHEDFERVTAKALDFALVQGELNGLTATPADPTAAFKTRRAAV